MKASCPEPICLGKGKLIRMEYTLAALGFPDHTHAHVECLIKAKRELIKRRKQASKPHPWAPDGKFLR